MSMLSPNTPASTPGDSGKPQSVQQMAKAIQTIVAQNGTRWRRLTLLEGIGLVIATPLGFLWVVFLVDNVLHLSMPGRIIALLIFLAGTAYLATRLVRRWKQLKLTEDQVALAIEKRTPNGVDNRLINAIQIARDGKGEHRLQFEQALIQENYHRLHEIQLQQAALARPAMIRLACAALAIVIGVGFWFLLPEYFTNAAQRILMPLGHIEPLYRTRLAITQGNLTDRGDYPIRIAIEGKQPGELLIIQNRGGQRSTTRLPISADQPTMDYTFTDVRTSMTFAVVGGDYTTAYYQITVPRPAVLSQVRATYEFPKYTKLPPKQILSADGRLQALQGTFARVNFILDQPAESAKLVILRSVDSTKLKAAIPLTPGNEPGSFKGEITFTDVVGYQLLTKRADDKEFYQSPVYSLTASLDQDPSLELRGLADQSEIDFDLPIELQAIANDDYGLRQVGLFYRNNSAAASNAVSASTPNTQDNPLLAFLEPQTSEQQTPEAQSQPWSEMKTWPTGDQTTFSASHPLQVQELGTAEGDQLDLVLQAQDNDPAKLDKWSKGSIYRVTIGGQGVTLQITYEKILRDEAQLRQILNAQQKVRSQSVTWLQKLDPSSGFDAQAATGAAQYISGMDQLAKGQAKLREVTSSLARQLSEQSGNLRMSVGMLADTEMIRSVRILERAGNPNESEQRRTTLANGRLTQDRIIQSLEDILKAHVEFRQEWENLNMAAFIHMMAQRQASLVTQSTRLASQSSVSAGARQTASRRQQKLGDLTQLAATASTGVGQRLAEEMPTLANAFEQASKLLADKKLAAVMQQSATLAAAGSWSTAIPQQAQASTMLAEIDQLIDNARKEAAKQAIALLEATELELSKTLSQSEIEELRKNAGYLAIDAPENMSIRQIIALREKIEQQKKDELEKEQKKHMDFLLKDSELARLNRPTTDRVDSDTLKLASVAGQSDVRSPNQTDRQGNDVPPNISEDFEDVVGDLLEGLEKLTEDYDTLNLNANFSLTDPGEIGQQAGDINSNSASAATGNMKPPENQIGGMARSGRKGARSHGTAIGDESFNRRGRDEAQEGMEKVKDVAGRMREVETGDPQLDVSTGVGGKVIDTKESHFSIKDKGAWTDDMADRMQKPLEKNQIVERQGGPRMDPKVAKMLYELEGTQEQIVERLKVIRKKLDNLYLPTDQIDELMAQLNANLDALRDRPDAELFRKQLQTIEQIRGTVRVFGQAHSGFEPSLPREQIIRGNVLDDPARQTLPGYDEAVKNYYIMLSNQ